MNENVKLVYDDVRELFPVSDLEIHQYVRRNWIFPNHIDIMLDLCEDMCSRYGGNLEICQLGGVLHDTGLVYGRESASSEGHEERSLEYGRNMLEKHSFDEETIKRVLGCIAATEPEIEPQSKEQKIVRTADAYSQFISIHFVAKAAFSGDIDWYVGWLENKVEKNLEKICFDKEKGNAKRVAEYYSNAVEMYHKYNS